MEYYYTPRLIKKFINQIEINYKENLINVDSNKNKETMFLASTIVSAMQIFNREDIRDNIINLIDDLPPIFNYTEKYQKQFSIFSKNNDDNNKKNEQYKEIINKYIEDFSGKNIYIDRKLLKEYIKIIFYKEKIPNKEAFSNLISKYYEGKENMENIITKINKYFSIFSSDILLKNLQDAILEIIDDKNIYHIANILKELNESLKKYEINFLENSQKLADKILQYNADKYDTYYINGINNIFYIYVNFINKDIYKNIIGDIFNNVLHQYQTNKYNYNKVTNLLFDFIKIIVSNNKNFNINDYDFLIDYINKNNGYIYLLLGNYENSINSEGNCYYLFSVFNMEIKKNIFNLFYNENISNIIDIMLKGLTTNTLHKTITTNNININDIVIANGDIWILLFNDLYASEKIDKDNSYKLINIGFELISKEKQYILYFIAFDYFYIYKEFPIDNEKMKKLKPRNYVYIIIMCIYKYINKDNIIYDNINKTVIKNIIYNFNQFRLNELMANSFNIIDYIINNIYNESENKEDDEYYQDLKKLKDDLKNNINHS
ncbi:hypothetical protein [Brachyspira hyodysenteriae]|uniref:hypothetical protein n=1 Tax=Brachyspira hyodysenteriae TaxID=159 RepID=UPI00063DA703|nr:hypothetical protein [Brachyspira hyodysenteriae]KLI59005.1 hypothetical protein SZ44_10015 [Brachyspira hyodysenteriae]